MAALFGLLVGGALGSMYDVAMPLYTPTCTNGCLPWADAAKSLSPHLNLTRKLRHKSSLCRGTCPLWTKQSIPFRDDALRTSVPLFSWLQACRTHTCGVVVLVSSLVLACLTRP